MNLGNVLIVREVLSSDTGAKRMLLWISQPSGLRPEHFEQKCLPKPERKALIKIDWEFDMSSLQFWWMSLHLNTSNKRLFDCFKVWCEKFPAQDLGGTYDVDFTYCESMLRQGHDFEIRWLWFFVWYSRFDLHWDCEQWLLRWVWRALPWLLSSIFFLSAVRSRSMTSSCFNSRLFVFVSAGWCPRDLVLLNVLRVWRVRIFASSTHRVCGWLELIRAVIREWIIHIGRERIWRHMGVHRRDTYFGSWSKGFLVSDWPSDLIYIFMLPWWNISSIEYQRRQRQSPSFRVDSMRIIDPRD